LHFEGGECRPFRQNSQIYDIQEICIFEIIMQTS